MTTYYDTNTATADIDDLNLDLGTVEAQADFSPIPAGDYQVQCVAVDLATSNAGNRMIKAQFQVLGGEYDNRRIFENYNIQHHNPQVSEISLRSIKSWVIASGLTGNERLTMALLKGLEGVEFLASVKIEQDKTGQYGPQNRIKAYKPLPGATAQSAPASRPAAPSGATPPPAVRAASAPAKPWERARA